MIEIKVLPSSWEVKTISIDEVVDLLPNKLPWKVNLWIAGKIARFGLTTDALIFLVEMKEEPSVEMRMFFENLFKPYPATVIEDWKSQEYSAVRLYNNGKLIIDKDKMVYKELPTPVYSAPIMTIEEMKEVLPKEIPFKYTLHLTGGLVKNGFTCNDADFIAFDVQDTTELLKMAKYFTKVLGWKTDVGNKVMPEREPVYCYKIYKDGKCLL